MKLGKFFRGYLALNIAEAQVIVTVNESKMIFTIYLHNDQY
jgi:hypothetical protein